MQARTLAALALGIALPLSAQQIDDPANLMGERVSAPALADTLPINHGAPALEQLLRKLRTRASLMLIVAHPDDEDSGMLTFESRGEGARVAMLTLNRGEGGQNLMSADFNDALGLIRTQELLAEDRYTGTDQFFGTEVDFGFSKTKEEAFRKWTHQRVLYDAVRAVRLYRPLVLASVFIGEPTDGHGQHQVSGEIAQEVFLAAADPKIFPEMGLPPWAPLKVYARVPFAQIDSHGMFDYATGKYLPPRFENYVTGQVSTTPPTATVTIHEGDKPDIPAFEGKSYIQWARQGLALQKSQIGAGFRLPPAGNYDVGYTLYGSRVPCPAGTPTIPNSPALRNSGCPTHHAAISGSGAADSSLFGGIDTSLSSIADLAPDGPLSLRTTLATIDQQLAEAEAHFNPAHPERTQPALTDSLRGFSALIVSVEQSLLSPSEKFDLLHELRVKAVQADQALLLAMSVNVVAETHITQSPGGAPRPAIARIDDANPRDPFAVQVRVESSSNKELNANKGSVNTNVTAHHRVAESCPYFDRSDLNVPYYEVSPADLRNAPAKPAFWNEIAINVPGLILLAKAEITNGGEPLRVVPPINVTMLSEAGIFNARDATFPGPSKSRHRQSEQRERHPCASNCPPHGRFLPSPSPLRSTVPTAGTPMCSPSRSLPQMHKPTQLTCSKHKLALGLPTLPRDIARSAIPDFRTATSAGAPFIKRTPSTSPPPPISALPISPVPATSSPCTSPTWA